MSVALKRCRTYSRTVSIFKARRCLFSQSPDERLDLPNPAFDDSEIWSKSHVWKPADDHVRAKRPRPSSNLYSLIENLSHTPPKRLETKTPPSKHSQYLPPFPKPTSIPQRTQSAHTPAEVEGFLSLVRSLLLEDQSSLPTIWHQVEAHYYARREGRIEGEEKTLLLEVLDRIVRDWLSGTLQDGVPLPSEVLCFYVERHLMRAEFWAPIITRITFYMFSSSTSRSDDAPADPSTGIPNDVCLRELLRLWRMFFQIYAAASDTAGDPQLQNANHERNLWPFLPLDEAMYKNPKSNHYLPRFLGMVPQWKAELDLGENIHWLPSRRIAVCAVHTFAVLANRTLSRDATEMCWAGKQISHDEFMRDRKDSLYRIEASAESIRPCVNYVDAAQYPIMRSDHEEMKQILRDRAHLNMNQQPRIPETASGNLEGSFSGDGQPTEHSLHENINHDLSCDEESYLYLLSRLLSNTGMLKFDHRFLNSFPKGFPTWLQQSQQTLLARATRIVKEVGEPKRVNNERRWKSDERKPQSEEPKSDIEASESNTSPSILIVNGKSIARHLYQAQSRQSSFHQVYLLWQSILRAHMSGDANGAIFDYELDSDGTRISVQLRLGKPKSFDAQWAAAFVNAFLFFDRIELANEVCVTFDSDLCATDKDQALFWRRVWFYVMKHCARRSDKTAFKIAYTKSVDSGGSPTEFGQVLLHAMRRGDKDDLEYWLREAARMHIGFDDAWCGRLLKCNFGRGPASVATTDDTAKHTAIEDVFELRYGRGFRQTLNAVKTLSDEDQHTTENQTIREEGSRMLTSIIETYHVILETMDRPRKAPGTKEHRNLPKAMSLRQGQGVLAVWHHLLGVGISPNTMSDCLAGLMSAITSSDSPDWGLIERLAQYKPQDSSTTQGLFQRLTESFIFTSQLPQLEKQLEIARAQGIYANGKTLSRTLRYLMSKGRLGSAEQMIRHAETNQKDSSTSKADPSMGSFWRFVQQERLSGRIAPGFNSPDETPSTAQTPRCPRCSTDFTSWAELQRHAPTCTNARKIGFWGLPVRRTKTQVAGVESQLPGPRTQVVDAMTRTIDVVKEGSSRVRGLRPTPTENPFQHASGFTTLEQAPGFVFTRDAVATQPASEVSHSFLKHQLPPQRLSPSQVSDLSMDHTICPTCNMMFPVSGLPAGVRPCSIEAPFCCHCKTRFPSKQPLLEHFFECAPRNLPQTSMLPWRIHRDQEFQSRVR